MFLGFCGDHLGSVIEESNAFKACELKWSQVSFPSLTEVEGMLWEDVTQIAFQDVWFLPVLLS